ncbi:hypothetical protein [Meiothermus sp. CFH 77666]|uniref:ParA family protein n=1 Tax=Meiothermus sp. CFH 77666 TaxID=2817942 RepID=UPI001FB09183|nr:hypothetical protein [Meiothermus sp. CFH 77666]
MRVLVTSLKGGVGRITTAIHLAAFLQLRGPNLLVDAEPAGGAGLGVAGVGVAL